MHKFDDGFEFGECGKRFLQEVLDRLDIVVNVFLDRLDAFGIINREVSP